MRVYKYEIPVPSDDASGSEVWIPRGAKVLSVGVQGDRIYTWALVDPSASLEPLRFWVHGTGHDLSIGALASRFLGTVFPGTLVFHVFGGRP